MPRSDKDRLVDRHLDLSHPMSVECSKRGCELGEIQHLIAVFPPIHNLSCYIPPYVRQCTGGLIPQVMIDASNLSQLFRCNTLYLHQTFFFFVLVTGLTINCYKGATRIPIIQRLPTFAVPTPPFSFFPLTRKGVVVDACSSSVPSSDSIFLFVGLAEESQALSKTVLSWGGPATVILHSSPSHTRPAHLPPT